MFDCLFHIIMQYIDLNYRNPYASLWTIVVHNFYE